MTKRNETTVRIGLPGEPLSEPMTMSEFKRRALAVAKGGAGMRAATEQVQHVFDFKAAQKKAAEIQQMEEHLPELQDAAKETAEKAERSPEAKALCLVKEEIKARRAELLDEDEELADLAKKRRKAAKAWKESAAAAEVAAAKAAAKNCEAAIRSESSRLAAGLANSAK